jgi:hypothetical protein
LLLLALLSRHIDKLRKPLLDLAPNLCQVLFWAKIWPRCAEMHVDLFSLNLGMIGVICGRRVLKPWVLSLPSCCGGDPTSIFL